MKNIFEFVCVKNIAGGALNLWHLVSAKGFWKVHLS